MANLYQTPYAPGCTSYTEMIEALKRERPLSRHLDIQLLWTGSCQGVQGAMSADSDSCKRRSNFDNLHTWFENGVDSVGLGGLWQRGSSADIAENARKLRAIVEESGRLTDMSKELFSLHRGAMRLWCAGLENDWALGYEMNINTTGKPLSREAFVNMRKSTGIIVGVDELDGELLKECRSLKAVVKFGVGTDNID